MESVARRRLSERVDGEVGGEEGGVQQRLESEVEEEEEESEEVDSTAIDGIWYGRRPAPYSPILLNSGRCTAHTFPKHLLSPLSSIFLPSP